MRRRFTVRTGLETFGPLFETPPAPPTGDPAPSGSGSGDPKPPAGGAPPAPPAPPADPPAGQTVPYARFKEVNDELAKRKLADEERERAELTAKGEHEKVASQEKEKRIEAEAGRDAAYRELAFVTAAAGKVSDVAAAYKLATADGVLSAIELDADSHKAKDPKAVDTAIGELVKTYAFLKPGPAGTGRGYGSDHGGQDPTAGLDVEKLSAREKMELGITQASRR
jgi:hypothetical protein